MSFRDPAVAKIAQLVAASTGLYFSESRRADAEAGIGRAMARAELTDGERYLELLESGELPLDDLIRELTVSETHFFREPNQFRFIRWHVLPAIMSERGPEHALRMWSAGCASGEEAYSLAIVLEEAGVRGHVLGTDISKDALRAAHKGAYGAWSLRGLDDARKARFFERIGARLAAGARLRARVSFELHNLARGAYPAFTAGPPGMDLILCRNVFIYFDPEAIARAARMLHDCLAPGGWLVTGPSDPLLEEMAPLTAVITDEGIFYRRSDTSPRTAAQKPALALAPAPAQEGRPPAPPPRKEPPPARARPRAGLDAPEPLCEARTAFNAGRYKRALELTRDAGDEASAVLHVRAAANCRGAALALRELQRRLVRHPLCVELHFLNAALLSDLGRHDEAARALKRVLYLDRSLAIPNLMLGAVLKRRGDLAGARRAYRNARDLSRARPPFERLPLGDGERAGRVAELAESELATLQARQPA